MQKNEEAVMKKPNITPGEWSHGIDATHPYSPLAIVYSETGTPIADVEPILDGPEFADDIIANTKAISAVPDMIDALMELLQLNQCEQEGIGSGMPTPEQWKKAFYKAGQSLIKAGVEL